ncbi:4Fe-4S binding protein [Antarcticimicrobium luteum]|uniref:4Fe-4S dicluster domain-containing protein n=1 Tax=Antarcticimicrobium luteum TaxID=2547397 RepID=A0A4R5VD28_9RHOB|nr:4Fe-4S binding protein [Antarcticimicrobium luteum]TDK50171.1 4Fe-4S dicluster domain-containing protein [Antarcticimicrobium luteum]
MTKQLILCDCLGSQTLDREALSRATGLPCSRVHTALCTREIDSAAEAIAAGEAIVACAQEAPRFEELAVELGTAAPLCVDIRDRAGWGEGGESLAKMSALIAEARLDAPPAKTVDVTSDGLCLILGRADVALPAAERLADTLAVTVLLLDGADDLPLSRRYEVITGDLKRAQGSFGNFTLRLDRLRMLEPGGRGDFVLSPPRNGAETGCDLILDLSGNTPLFPAPHKRDGYLRADPGSASAVAEAVFEAAQMLGTFEKTLYLTLEEHLCAHSRAGQVGCTRCLDICPTGAISPEGEHVTVDAMICAGCGACSSLCPSGAIKYDAPPAAHLVTRVRTLAEAYRAAGGAAPRLLVHDEDHGTGMIALSARFGRGMPADVIPLAVPALAGFGHAEMLAALASGFAGVTILPGPRTERDPIGREIALATAMGGAGRVALLDVDTPDAMSDALYAETAQATDVSPVLLMGDRRQVARLAAKAQMPGQDSPVPLPDGAPYGAVLVDTDTCTLCLSCVSLCPSGALIDNPDLPQLRFQEDACLQCGICATVCPETAITLEPRFDPGDGAMAQKVLNEEEPFCCIECGAAFGVKSTVEKIVEKLAGKHSMFTGTDAARLIQMCDDCRIRAQYHSADNPLGSRDRPRVRTTEDYFGQRRDH